MTNEIAQLAREIAQLAQSAQSSRAQWVEAIGTIVAAVATILAVIVALFKDSVLRWLRGPRLDAKCEDKPPYTAKVPWHERGWTGDRYWVRINVENSGKTRAEKVEVYASELSKREAGNKFAAIPTFLPLGMKWSHPDATVIRDGISPKMSAFCDIIALCDPDNPNPRFQKLGFNLAELQLEAVTPSNLLPPGTYQLTLRIAAANANPIDKTLEFTHTGRGFTALRLIKG
jgi:hypothetical protein